MIGNNTATLKIVQFARLPTGERDMWHNSLARTRGYSAVDFSCRTIHHAANGPETSCKRVCRTSIWHGSTNAYTKSLDELFSGKSTTLLPDDENQ
jgi:hypothetical protein